MGWDRTSPADWAAYDSATAGRSVHDYRTAGLDPDFDPTKFRIRESRDSPLNPQSTPLIFGLDGTGSMGRVVEAMRKQLGVLFLETIERKPISDPHVLAMIVGDFECDRWPVQATQFESDAVVIGRQIERLTIEGGGGGNSFEGYLGPLYFAAMRTSCDAFKQGRKGILITCGDEEPQPVLTRAAVKTFFGDDVQVDLKAEDLVQAVSANWHYFHLMVEEGSYMSSRRDAVVSKWTKLIGQRAIPLADHTRMAEVAISAMQVIAGVDKDAVVKSWSGSTSKVVARAIQGLAPTGTPRRGLFRL